MITRTIVSNGASASEKSVSVDRCVVGDAADVIYVSRVCTNDTLIYHLLATMRFENREQIYRDVGSMTVAAVETKVSDYAQVSKTRHLLVIRIVIRDCGVVTDIVVTNKVIATCDLEPRTETPSKGRVFVVNPCKGSARVSELSDTAVTSVDTTE